MAELSLSLRCAMMVLAWFQTADDVYRMFYPMEDEQLPWTLPTDYFVMAIGFSIASMFSLVMNAAFIYACAMGNWRFLRMVEPWYMVSQTVDLMAPMRYIAIKVEDNADELSKPYALHAILTICLRLVTIGLVFFAMQELAA